tara:strand:+ start:118 stop:651 length:534 start_codon:yes stop_codon:yes gene_type:complete
MNKKGLIIGLKRKISHLFFGGKKKNARWVASFAKGIHNKKILEIGSGDSEHYSLKKHFDDSNEFIQSDIVPSFGRKIVDVRDIKEKEEYDIILCIAVMEHVFENTKALDSLYKALKKGGTLLITFTFMKPLHLEPYDYWRYTEHGVRKLLEPYANVEIKTVGWIRELAQWYCVEAVK